MCNGQLPSGLELRLESVELYCYSSGVLDDIFNTANIIHKNLAPF